MKFIFQIRPKLGIFTKTDHFTVEFDLCFIHHFLFYLLDQLINHVEKQKFELENSKNDIKTIFITSPVEVAEMIGKVGRVYRGYTVFTTKDTHKFLGEYRKTCDTIGQLYGDILSTLEKEILVHSYCYYRMRPSNWSFNVQAHRWAKNVTGLKYDSVIYDIFMTDECDKKCLNG